MAPRSRRERIASLSDREARARLSRINITTGGRGRLRLLLHFAVKCPLWVASRHFSKFGNRSKADAGCFVSSIIKPLPHLDKQIARTCHSVSPHAVGPPANSVCLVV